VLLADEPTGNLDSVHGAAVMELLAELHESGLTIVRVTHDRRFARYAKRMVGLLDGRLADARELVEARL
jgi:putative ABC transport system ATP-binding protein